MTFQPVVPFGGYAGWKFLQQTRVAQEATFRQSRAIRDQTEYFSRNILAVSTPDQIVNDRRLLTVALGAFGLDDDLNHKFFIKKVLADGTARTDALANRLADKSYYRLSKTFGFDRPFLDKIGLPPQTKMLADQFASRKFAEAVGSVNEDMRLALNFSNDAVSLLSEQRTSDGRWFAIMGNPPLRRFVELAFNLPLSIGGIDIDRQKEVFAERSERFFGSRDPSVFIGAEQKDRMIQLFFANSTQSSPNIGQVSGSIALQLLQTG